MNEMNMNGDMMVYGMGPFGAILMLLVLVLSVFAFWRIFAKAGYSGAWGLLALFPVLQFFMLLFLAFSTWPSQAARGVSR